MFDIILETGQDSDIVLNVINKYASLPSINDNGTYSRSKLRNSSKTFSLCHQLQRKIQKKVHYYSHKSIDYFRLIVVNLPPKLTGQEKRSIMTYFGYSSQDQSIENNTKIIMTHILNRLNGNNSSTHPSTHTMSPSESVSLKVYYIELKYYCLYFLIYSQSDSLYIETSL